ncbi:MAG: transposase [Armatimonadetes bacterium]|nr:transposase [Armatimonadota bacterium]
MRNEVGTIIRYARRFCGGVRVTQVDNFVRLCTALWLTRSLVLSQLALVMEGPKRHAHRLKRLFRFLSNPRFPAQQVMDRLAMHNLAAALQVGARKIVLFDVTHLTENLAVLAAAIALRGRAVPLALWAYDPQQLQRSLNTVTHELLAHLRAQLGPFIAVADRGFGHAWPVRACRQLGVDFVLRIRGNVIITAAGRTAPAKDFTPRRGTAFYPNARYGLHHRLQVNFVAVAAQDPWLLITSLEDFRRAPKLYSQRMQIEQTFRDLKTHLGLKNLCLTSPRRLQVLLGARIPVWEASRPRLPARRTPQALSSSP